MVKPEKFDNFFMVLATNKPDFTFTFCVEYNAKIYDANNLNKK